MFIPTYAISEDDKELLRKLVAELLEHGESIAVGTDGDGLEMRLIFFGANIRSLSSSNIYPRVIANEIRSIQRLLRRRPSDLRYLRRRTCRLRRTDYERIA